jgi:hypothetical protein
MEEPGGRTKEEAREIVEAILRMAEKCDGRTLYFKRGVAHRDGGFIPAQQWMNELVAVALAARSAPAATPPPQNPPMRPHVCDVAFQDDGSIGCSEAHLHPSNPPASPPSDLGRQAVTASTEYGVSGYVVVEKTQPARASRVDPREAILERVALYAGVAVSQIICMGGPETCQPCENRELLAQALQELKAASTGTGTSGPALLGGEHASGGVEKTDALSSDEATRGREADVWVAAQLLVAAVPRPEEG